jgi:UDP-N-acetylglucosamine acyltransferase
MTIHPTALIEEGAQIHPTAHVGPFCCVGPHVSLGPEVTLVSHVSLAGITEIGEGTKIYPFASIGHPPQDLKYAGEASRLIIGKRNVIREYVTLQPGTLGGGMLTQVGDECLFMVGVHIAHDCIIGNQVIMANNATLGGHVMVGDRAVIGGLSGIHQFVRIGAYAMIGGLSGVENDVIPFGMVVGERAYLSGLNLVGMKRLGLPREEIHVLRGVYKDLFKEDKIFTERLAHIEEKFPHHPHVAQILDFIKKEGDRPLCMPQSSPSPA